MESNKKMKIIIIVLIGLLLLTGVNTLAQKRMIEKYKDYSNALTKTCNSVIKQNNLCLDLLSNNTLEHLEEIEEIK